MRFTTLLNFELDRPRRAARARVALSSTPCVLSQSGTFMTQEDCLARTSCGWKFKCEDGACVQAPDGTYETQAACFQSCYKYGCDGKGSCVRQAGGQYTTLAECKCFGCVDNACAPVGVNVQGDYTTLSECQYDPQRQCGWKYACATDGDASTLCKFVPGPEGTYDAAEDCRCVSAVGSPGPTCACGYNASVTGNAKYATMAECEADATDMCGWKYTCPPPPLSFEIVAGGKSGLTVGDGCNPAFVYIAIGPSFVAYTSTAEITVGTPRARVTGSVVPSFVEVRLVVASFGNYEAEKLDPTTETRTVRVGASASCPGSPYDRTINVGANIVAAANPLTMGGADIPNTEFPTFTNTRVALQPGWQYQVFAQVLGVTFNKPAVTWTGGRIDLV
jgi:hypothetical protein